MLFRSIRLWADLTPHLPPRATGAWLLWREPEHVSVVAMDGRKTIGRGDDADVRVDCRWLSRRHFTIRPAAGEFEIEDLGGKNSVHVNAETVHTRSLISGDVIRVGDMEFLFVIA